MSKSRDAVEDIRTIDTVTATANAALPKAGGALTGTVTNFTSTGIDDNATSTAVTIDASENVMVGQTSVNTANNGHSFGANGNYAHHTSTESTTLILNRKTNDGDIVRLRKDNGAVGSIGTYLNASYMTGSGSKGIFLNGNLNPAGASGGIDDNTQNIGASNRRWKDLYLSGGVYLGGTGGANKLDDYEEGTWTFAMTGSTGSVGSYTQAGAVGTYTKIGDMVYFNGTSYVSDKGSYTGNLIIEGLPFASNASTNVAASVSGLPISAFGANVYGALINADNTFITFRRGLYLDDTAAWSELTPNVRVYVSGSYKIA